MPEPDDESRDPIPISALQHWCYCPRQCGLIHPEQAFEENVHTLQGRAVHSAVDTPGLETRAGVRTERALPLFHDRLGLVGKADAVEFENAVTRVIRPGEPEGEIRLWENSTPEERMNAVWELTLQCVAWEPSAAGEPRLQRSVVRIQRARR